MGSWKFALVPALALLACAPFSVRYDIDPQARFPELKTFGWRADAKGAGPEHALMERRLRRIVERELAARGYLRQDGGPDLLLTCYPVYHDRIVQSTTTLGPAWGYGWGRPWRYGYGLGFATGIQETRAYREGSIVLEAAERTTGQMVWRAVAEGALTDVREPEDAEEQATRAVRKMLEKLPPPAR